MTNPDKSRTDLQRAKGTCKNNPNGIPSEVMYMYGNYPETETFDEETWNELNDDVDPYELDYDHIEFNFDDFH